MNNRLLSITRRSIPYIPELNAITGGAIATILMQQLDYWFEQKPEGFYKFMEPCQHPLYQPDDSWTEEVGLTRNEFRAAFDSIGYRFSSKSDYNNAPDKFMGRMYASYVDRKSNLTYYFRNHSLVDQRLDELIYAKKHSQVVELKADPKPSVTPTNLSVTPTNLSVSHPELSVSPTHLRGQGIDIVDVAPTIPSPQGSGIPTVPYTETTTENTSINKQLLQPLPVDQALIGSSSSLDKNVKLFYPNLLGGELKNIEKALEFCPVAFHQDVLDEIEGVRACGKITRGAVPLAKALIKAIAAGQFNLSAGVQVRSQREKRYATEEALRSSMVPTVQPGPVSTEVLGKLPANIARRVAEAQAKNNISESSS